MRCLLILLAMTLVGLGAFPHSVGAQDGGGTTEPNVQEPAPSSEPAPEDPEPSAEPAPEEPALQLKLDDAGVDVAPTPPRTPDGYTLGEMERRVMRAKVGLGVSVPFMAFGAMMTGLGASPFCFEDTFASPGEETCPDSVPGLLAAGSVVLAGSLGGTITSSILLRQRKRALSELQLAHYGVPKRTRRGYTVDEAGLRMKRARIGLGVSAGFSVLGLALAIAGRFGDCQFYPFPSRCDPLAIAGFTFIGAGVVGMITTGILSVRRTRDRYWLRREDYGTPRRVQSDPARSRFVF